MRKKEVEKDVGRYKALDIIASMEGGKLLQEAYLKDMMTQIDRLANNFKSATMQEIVGWCASLKVNLDAYRILTRAGKNKKIAETELKAILTDKETETE